MSTHIFLDPHYSQVLTFPEPPNKHRETALELCKPYMQANGMSHLDSANQDKLVSLKQARLACLL